MSDGIVLYVDDDDAFVDLVQRRLSMSLDRDVETVSSPSAALERLADGGVDCLVLDYYFPGVEGPEVLANVRERDPDVPVVFFTGLDAADADDVDAAAFVRKGVGGFDDLTEAVADALDGE